MRVAAYLLTWGIWPMTFTFWCYLCRTVILRVYSPELPSTNMYCLSALSISLSLCTLALNTFACKILESVNRLRFLLPDLTYQDILSADSAGRGSELYNSTTERWPDGGTISGKSPMLSAQTLYAGAASIHFSGRDISSDRNWYVASARQAGLQFSVSRLDHSGGCTDRTAWPAVHLLKLYFMASLKWSYHHSTHSPNLSYPVTLIKTATLQPTWCVGASRKYYHRLNTYTTLWYYHRLNGIIMKDESIMLYVIQTAWSYWRG